MPITKLRFNNVGPFDDVEFEFDSQVNVFTGPNNSGKSTALWVLADIVVFPFDFPSKLLKTDNAEVGLRLVTGSEEHEVSGAFPIIATEFGNFGQTVQWLGTLKKVGYTSFNPALRQSTDFRSGGPAAEKRPYNWWLSDKAGIPRGAFGQLGTPFRLERGEDTELRRRAAASMSTGASLVSNEAVIQKMIELDYRAYRQDDRSIRVIISKVATITSEITEGFPIQFLGVAEDEGGLYPQFRTPDGDMPLNVLSQGTQSIIQWLAHLLIGYAEYYDYPPNLEEKPGILIIDEIDAHLHPSWQRRIIPTLVKHFPNLQIFCSTHSPLMLAGLKAGQVQLLRRDDKGKVTVSRNEEDIKGWSADEILRNFLDLPNPTDLATVRHLERLQELRDKKKLSVKEAEELEQLRDKVHQTLLGGPITAQVEQLTALLKESKADFASRADASAPTKARTTRRRRNPAE